MSRRFAREEALKALYQYEFSGKTPNMEEQNNFESSPFKNEDAFNFMEDLVNGTIKNLSEIDSLIQRISKNWEMKRIASIDRNIIRFASYELLYRNDIPPKVTINEAVDIAKKYSTAESYSFVNGILDKIAQETRKRREDTPVIA